MIPGSRSRSRRRRVPAAAATLLGVALVGGSSVALAQPPEPYVELVLQDPCVFGGDTSPGATVTLTLRRAGSVVAKTTFTPSETTFRRCLAAAPRGGDRLSIKQTQGGTTLTQRTLDVPVLTLAMNAATDELDAHAEVGGVPAAGADGLLGLMQTLGGRPTQGPAISSQFDAEGNLGASFTGSADIVRGFIGSAQWYGSQNDSVRVLKALPAVAVRLGSSRVVGVSQPATDITVTLRKAGGGVRGKVTMPTRFVSGDPLVKGAFKNASGKVTAAVGNRVTSSRQPGSWTVLADTLVIDSGDGDGAVTLTCPAGVEAGLWLDGNQAATEGFPSGAVSFTDLFLPPGTKVEVVCQDANGFGQWFTRVAP